MNMISITSAGLVHFQILYGFSKYHHCLQAWLVHLYKDKDFLAELPLSKFYLGLSQNILSQQPTVHSLYIRKVHKVNRLMIYTIRSLCQSMKVCSYLAYPTCRRRIASQLLWHCVPQRFRSFLQIWIIHAGQISPHMYICTYKAWE